MEEIIYSSATKKRSRMVQMAQQQHGNTFLMDNVLNLRIEQIDKEGNIINVVPVEMRGKTVQGCKVKGKMNGEKICTNLNMEK